MQKKSRSHCIYSVIARFGHASCPNCLLGLVGWSLCLFRHGWSLDLVGSPFGHLACFATVACLAWSVGRFACFGKVARLTWSVGHLACCTVIACLAWSVGRFACFSTVARLTWLVGRLGTLHVSQWLLAVAISITQGIPE